MKSFDTLAKKLFKSGRVVATGGRTRRVQWADVCLLRVDGGWAVYAFIIRPPFQGEHFYVCGRGRSVRGALRDCLAQADLEVRWIGDEVKLY